MATIDSTTTVVRVPNLLFSAVDRDIVIFQMQHDAYFALDEIGADIWQRLERPTTVRALCDGLTGEYEADRAVIERDVLVLLAEMAAADLILASAT